MWKDFPFVGQPCCSWRLRKLSGLNFVKKSNGNFCYENKFKGNFCYEIESSSFYILYEAERGGSPREIKPYNATFLHINKHSVGHGRSFVRILKILFRHFKTQLISTFYLGLWFNICFWFGILCSISFPECKDSIYLCSVAITDVWLTVLEKK